MAATTTAVRPGPAGGDVPAGNVFFEYLQGVREELKKAQWPTRAELFQLTKVVLVIVFVVGAYCGALDGLLSLVTNALFTRR